MPKVFKQKPITETEIKVLIKQYLRIQGFFCFHVLQGIGAYKGVPDIIAVKNGRVLFLEVKTPRGSQSDCQMQFEADLTQAGGEYWLVRGLDDVMGIVKG